MWQAPARRLQQQVRWLTWVHPQFWVVGICLLAWTALLMNPHAGSGQAYCGARTADRAATPRPSDLLQWGTMVAAMMFPLILAQIRTIALSSRWRRRHLAIGWFLCAHLSVWLLARICSDLLALPYAGIFPATPPPAGPGVAAGAFALAGLWHLTPIKRRAATRCHRRTPLPMSGWRADMACLRYGARNGVDCITNCWPTMLAMIVVPYSLGLMAVLSCFMLADRYLWPVHTRLLPLVYAAVATGCALGSLLE